MTMTRPVLAAPGWVLIAALGGGGTTAGGGAVDRDREVSRRGSRAKSCC